MDGLHFLLAQVMSDKIARCKRITYGGVGMWMFFPAGKGIRHHYPCTMHLQDQCCGHKAPWCQSDTGNNQIYQVRQGRTAACLQSIWHSMIPGHFIRTTWLLLCLCWLTNIIWQWSTAAVVLPENWIVTWSRWIVIWVLITLLDECYLFPIFTQEAHRVSK